MPHSRRRWPKAVALALAAGATWFTWSTWSPGPIKVIDGDTVERRGIRHRLKGYDAPEIRQPKCKEERQRGITARSRLEQLLANAGSVALKPDIRLDRYGRMLSRLIIDGENVADIAVREGWGIRYNGAREPRPDWCFIAVPLMIRTAPAPSLQP